MTAETFTAVAKRPMGTIGASSFGNFPITAAGATSLGAITAGKTVNDVLEILNTDIRTALAVTENSTGQATSKDPVANGPIKTVTIQGTVSGKADGDHTEAVTDGNGTGAQITYTVASNVASGGTVAAAGDNFQVNDIVKVSSDPGVTFKVTAIN